MAKSQIWDGAAWVDMAGDAGHSHSEYLPLSGGVMTGAITQRPNGVIQAAGVGSVLQRWNGDGDTNGSRRYEWRRSASFGRIELYAVTNTSVSRKLLEFHSDGNSGGTIFTRVETTYDSVNKYDYQMANRILTDSWQGGSGSPSNASGQDGDLFFYYGP